MNDIILDHQIIVDKIGTVQTVRHDTADVRRRQEHIVRPFSGKKLVHSGLIRQIQFRMRTKQKVRIPLLRKLFRMAEPTKPR